MSKTMRKRTPWGLAQIATEIAPGITRYSTASHGGYYLDRYVNAQVSSVLKKASFCELGLRGWYEEDVDWAMVVYSFPQHFAPDCYKAAVECLKRYHKEAWEQL